MKPLTAILVDDEVLTRWITKRAIENLGITVFEAESCAEAEGKFLSLSFDLAILDHRLPDGFGVDILRKLRSNRWGGVAIYLTAETELIDEELQRSLDIYKLIKKPLNIEELKDVISGLSIVGKGQAAPLVESDFRKVGNFSLFAGKMLLNEESLEKVRNECSSSGWVAVDLKDINAISENEIKMLVELANTCRERRGRFCVVGASGKLISYFIEKGIDKEFDMVSDEDFLEALSRRPTSICERSMLLDSVIIRENKRE